MSIEEELLGHVRNSIKDQTMQINVDTALISNGLLDSFGILDLIQFVETRFNIKLENVDMNPENFETIGALSAMIRPKIDLRILP